MKRNFLVVSLMILFAALFVSCADGIKGSMDSGSYPMGGQSSGGGNNSGSGNGGGNSSGSGGTTILSGTVWKQSYNGSPINNGGTITFSSSGRKVTTSILGVNQEFDYTIVNENTANFTMHGSTTTSLNFVIDSFDDSKASYGGVEYTRIQ